MLGIYVKRGVESTLERVFKNSGQKFGNLSVAFNGSTAGIIFERKGDKLDAKVIFPNIDDTIEIPRSSFNNMIGYALHELGHAWFTDNDSWDNARKIHGAFLSNLINGLEDPRIERKVIESGYAPNSKALFEELINSVLEKQGYVEPDDVKNIPFLLAVEGRRLNGYDIDVPSIVDDSPYADDLRWALQTAQACASTHAVVQVAIELYRRLQSESSESDSKPDGKPDGKAEGKGDQQGDPSDGEGNPSDSNDGDDSERPSKPKRGRGRFDGGRDVEPTDFIEDELGSFKSTADDYRPRPAVGKPRIATFPWR